MTVLHAAYILDVVVTAPIALTMLTADRTLDRGVLHEKMPAERSTRVLLGALWTAILVCLAAGVFLPVTMAPVLLLQLIYKSLWIALFAAPRWATGRRKDVPWRMAGVFAAFIVVYPWIIPWSAMFSPHR